MSSQRRREQDTRHIMSNVECGQDNKKWNKRLVTKIVGGD